MDEFIIFCLHFTFAFTVLVNLPRDTDVSFPYFYMNCIGGLRLWESEKYPMDSAAPRVL